MKNLSLLLALLLSFTASLRAQTTTFSYQGRLNNPGGPAIGTYDFKFTLWTAPTGPGQVGGELSRPMVNITNGTFSVTLDFGSAAFDGGDRWLEISVRPDGATPFSTLDPRRPITSAPYAIRALTSGSADSVAATNLIGVLPQSSLPNSVVTNFTTNVTLTGTFLGSHNGNGAGLANLNGAQLTGVIPQTSLPAAAVTNNAASVTLTGTFSGSHNGNGAGLTNLNGAQLTGVIPQTSLPAAAVTNNSTGVTLTGAFTGDHHGDGSGLTGINDVARNLQISHPSISNPSIFDGNFYGFSTFIGTNVTALGFGWGPYGTQSFLTTNGSVELGNSRYFGNTPYIDFHYGTGTDEDYNVRLINDQSGRLKLEGNLLVNGTVDLGPTHPVYFKDVNSGIGQNGSVTNFNGLNGPDGPILWGYGGGALGSIDTGAKLGLVWTSAGRIGIGTTTPATALHVTSTGDAEISVQSKDPNAHRWTIQSGGDGAGPGPHTGAFDIIDRTLGIGRMHFTATGNVGIGTGTPSVKLEVAGEAKALIFTPTSDRNAKENFTAVAPSEVLAKVVAMPITQWNFKELPGTTHIGPMAQDFRAAFGTGADDRHISTVDADGVALAAIQGLNQKVESQKTELAEKQQQIESLEKRLEALEKLLGNRINNP